MTKHIFECNSNNWKALIQEKVFRSNMTHPNSPNCLRTRLEQYRAIISRGQWYGKALALLAAAERYGNQHVVLSGGKTGHRISISIELGIRTAFTPSIIMGKRSLDALFLFFNLNYSQLTRHVVGKTNSDKRHWKWSEKMENQVCLPGTTFYWLGTAHFNVGWSDGWWHFLRFVARFLWNLSVWLYNKDTGSLCFVHLMTLLRAVKYFKRCKLSSTMDKWNGLY